MNKKSERKSIREWALDDRPREKMVAKGPDALSNAELLATLLGSGNRLKSAVDLAKEILADNDNNLIKLAALEVSDLTKYKGIGIVKAINVKAALEIGKRHLEEKAAETITIKQSKEVFNYLFPQLASKTSEEFWILLLNRANKVIGKHLVSVGGFTGTVADPKKIFRIALENRATGLILCHNHPSGNLIPSDADIKLTNKLKEAGASLEIPVIDHIIIGQNSYFSFSDEGIL